MSIFGAGNKKTHIMHLPLSYCNRKFKPYNTGQCQPEFNFGVNGLAYANAMHG